MLTRKILAAFVLCVMVAVAAMPAVIGADGDTPLGETFEVKRPPGLGSPKNAASTVMYNDIPENGMFYLTIEWAGLSAVKLEISDITDGGPILLSSERIRAPKDMSPSMSTPVAVNAGYDIQVYAQPGGGPKDLPAYLQAWLAPPEPIKPVAVIATPVISDLSVDFDGSGSYDPDGMVVAWDWDFDDGIGSGEMVSHVYSAYGTYTVTLVVTDDSGLLSDPAYVDVLLAPISGEHYTYMFSDMGQNYLKSTENADLGRVTTTSGVNSWWPMREIGYGELMVRNTYPYVLAWPVWSENTAPDSPDTDAGFQLSSFYRLTIDADEVPIGTGPGSDPILIPLLDNTYYPTAGLPIPDRLAMDGGTVTFEYYGTYLTTDELYAIKDGTHYANDYFGVGARPFPNLPPQDDGWWHELQGTMTFDRAGAIKFLGLEGAGDLRDEFNLVNAGTDPKLGEISLAWQDDIMLETGGGGIYDIYTCYDYSNDIRYTGVTLDEAASTADSLSIRLFSVSWGNEMLMTRLLEAAGILTEVQTYNEDFTISGTIESTMANIDVSAIVNYQLTATADDGSPGTPTWSLESMHVDYCGNVMWHESYVSPYNPYDPDVLPEVTKVSTNPATVNFGSPVNYWYTPLEWDLDANEVLIIQLPDGSFGGYTPEAGSGELGDANNHWVDGGELQPGTGAVELGSYEPSTKTLTFVGPLNFPTNTNPLFPGLLESGTTFNFVAV